MKALTNIIISLILLTPLYGVCGFDDVEIRGIIDARTHYSDSLRSWLNGGSGVYRFDESNNGEILLSNISAELRFDTSIDSAIKIAAHYYPSQTKGFEISEAYWQYRPLSSSTWKGKYRVGAFYPSISVENRGRLWTSSQMTSFSHINSWIAEELRIIGAEGHWSRKINSHQKLGVFASAFWFNDPSGAAIAWKGWSNHDRQTGLGGHLPLQAAPGLVATANEQANSFAPFREIDGQPGFYLGLEWSQAREHKIQLMYYDNRADDTMFKDGQYGWRTRFFHLSAHKQLTPQWQVYGQYMNGYTVMDRNFTDNPFQSTYITLAKKQDSHRLALRLEHSRIQDRDSTPQDSNQSTGNSLTLSYAYLLKKSWKLGLEANLHNSQQRRRMYWNEPQNAREKQLTASLKYFF